MSFGTGLIPRDYREFPTGCFAVAPAAGDEIIIPEVEWAERLAEQKANRASLNDVRELYYDDLKSLDQNGFGLCWAFSSTKAAMYLRARQGQKRERLAAYYVAGKVKNWRDQGWFGAASLTFIANNGVPLESMCPAYDRRYDTAEVAADAATRKITEWWDGADDYDTRRAQVISTLLRAIPGVSDYNFLGHSMCAHHLESLNPLEIWADNSWGESAPRGLFKLKGRQAIPDAVVFPRVIFAS